jgi:flagellar P-ring protein precursor FlgI
MKKYTVMTLSFYLVFTVHLAMTNAQQNVRIKDVASVTGLEDIQVFGYGLVVGLARTGDRSQTVFTTQTIRNMLKNMGIEIPDQYIRIRNVAAVMVTGTISPFKRKGTRFDVIVSSIGDASSLEGGTLILTPIQGPDGKIYASAQGPIATGGYDIRNKGLSHIKKNHVLVGRIPDGAIVQKEYPFNVLNTDDLSLSLFTPDFTSAVSMAKSINSAYVDQIVGKSFVAKALDASTVLLNFNVLARDSIRNYIDIVEFISHVENITFDIDMPAKVVMNERTGTIVAGGNVRISEVAVTHGGVKVEIVNLPEVIQPQPFTLGATEVIPSPEMVVEEKDMEMVVLDQTTTVSDLAQALNSLGVASRDIIAIFQAIKEAGALQGKLIIM